MCMSWIVNAENSLVFVCVLQVCQYKPQTMQDSIPSLTFPLSLWRENFKIKGGTQPSHVLDTHVKNAVVYSDQVL